MIIAIDYDNTITANVAFFSAIIQLCDGHGVTPIIVTNRGPSWHVENDFGIPVVYCDKRPKRHVAREQGYEVSIWIDDLPVLVDFGAAGLSMGGTP